MLTDEFQCYSFIELLVVCRLSAGFFSLSNEYVVDGWSGSGGRFNKVATYLVFKDFASVIFRE